MLDPAGHAQDAGRQLWSGYERAETALFAQALALELERRGIESEITRRPGEALVPLQAASFSNRCKSSIFIRLELYKKPGSSTTITCMHQQYDALKDKAGETTHAFYPINQVHRKHLSSSKMLAEKILKECANTDGVSVRPLLGLPLKHLKGINAPALSLEIGLAADDNEWKKILEPVAEAIDAFIR